VLHSGGGNAFRFPRNQDAKQIERSVQEAGGETLGETLRLEPAPLPAARPLYDIERHSAALVDTEDLAPEDQEQRYALELHATLLAVVEKRDRVGQFLGHLESQIAFAHTEAPRLKAREELCSRARARMEGYVSRVIESLGINAKGKRKKLEGALSLHGCDKRVEIKDERARNSS
jgi:hypothetical protein